MKSPLLDLKKCEQKLNAICRNLAQKEAEKIKLDEKSSKLKTEISALHNSIRKSNNARNDIKEELNNIRHQVEKKLDEMNRTKANLLYKSIRDYDDMIRKLEYEMQLNRSFSAREEKRILDEIDKNKCRKTLHVFYEEQKHAHDELKEIERAKKNEQDLIWNQWTELKSSIHNMNDEIKLLNKEIQQYREDIDQLKAQKVDMKKQIEDLSREQIVKQQQIKRLTLDQLKHDKQKKDHLVIYMEETLRDYNKLITYFHKLIYGKDENHEIDNKLNASQSFMSSSFSSGSGGYQPSSESSSLASSTSSEQFNQFNFSANLKNQLTLGLSKLSLSSNSSNNLRTPTPTGNYSIKCNELMTPLPSPCFSTTSSLNTPCNDDHPPFFCGNGSYLMKKKNNEPTSSVPNRKNRKGTKKNKNSKIAHSVEVINLLSKMEIPIQLSSQMEECYKVLCERRDKHIHEMETYKKQQESNKQKALEEKQLNKLNNMSVNTSNAFSDTNSDVSSCLDSNYESDNNSIQSHQSSLFLETKNNSLGFKQVINSNKMQSEYSKGVLVGQSSNQVNPTSSTASSNGPVNSDDSDVTINESTLNEKELRTLSAQLKMNENNSSTSMTQTNQINVLTRAKSSPCHNYTIDADNKIELKNNFTFFRQISDGYSSSCTPLSASSITNEQPHINPFFPGTSSLSASAGLIQTNDPVETAYLNTNNLNK